MFHRQILTTVNTTRKFSSTICPSIYNGVIYSPPRHPIFLELISHMIKVSHQKQSYHYWVFCNYFHNAIQKYDHYLFQEESSKKSCAKCYDGFDRYGSCTNIKDGDEYIIKSRYADYPWK